MEPIKTTGQELVSRLKTLAWSAFWVTLTFVVDNFSQVLIGISLPNIETPIGAINTAVVVGLVINQISKYVHNKRAGEVE